MIVPPMPLRFRLLEQRRRPAAQLARRNRMIGVLFYFQSGRPAGVPGGITLGGMKGIWTPPLLTQFFGARVNADNLPASAATIQPGLPLRAIAVQAGKPLSLASTLASRRPRVSRTTSSRQFPNRTDQAGRHRQRLSEPIQFSDLVLNIARDAL
jgi:hypothetical protein